MTCIAWDGRLLAADGEGTYGDLITSLDRNKFHRVRHPEHGAMLAGLAGCVPSYAKWLASVARFGFDCGVANIDDAEGLFVDRAGRCWDAYPSGQWSRVVSYSAIGSGADLAYPVLRDGGSAVDAVRYAARHSATCGGTIRVYDPSSNLVVVLR